MTNIFQKTFVIDNIAKGCPAAIKCCAVLHILADPSLLSRVTSDIEFLLFNFYFF